MDKRRDGILQNNLFKIFLKLVSGQFKKFLYEYINFVWYQTLHQSNYSHSKTVVCSIILTSCKRGVGLVNRATTTILNMVSV